MFKEIPHLKRKPASLPKMDKHKVFFFLWCRFKVNTVSCATILKSSTAMVSIHSRSLIRLTNSLITPLKPYYSKILL